LAEGAALERQKANPLETLHSLVFIRPNPLFALYENLLIYVYLCAFAVVMTTAKKNSAQKVLLRRERGPAGRPCPLAGSLRHAR
jgi:hypothetical protein